MPLISLFGVMDAPARRVLSEMRRGKGVGGAIIARRDCERDRPASEWRIAKVASDVASDREAVIVKGGAWARTA